MSANQWQDLLATAAQPPVYAHLDGPSVQVLPASFSPQKGVGLGMEQGIVGPMTQIVRRH